MSATSPQVQTAALAGGFDKARLDALIAEHAHRPGALLPLLHAIQDEFGYVDDAMVPTVALALNLTRADVHGVITFYHDYRRAPAGARVLKLCAAEACQARGAAALIARAERRLGASLHATTADGRVTLEPIYCLGLCATAPSAMLDGKVVGRLTPAKLDALVMEAML